MCSWGRIFPLILSFFFFRLSFAQTQEDLNAALLEERQLLREEGSRKENLELLEEAKYYLVSGNLRRAEATLVKLRPVGEMATALRWRYLAMIHFVEGDYQKSLKILQKKELNTLSLRGKICTLKLTNMIILNELEGAKAEFDFCASINGKYSATEMSWLEFLLAVRQKDPSILAGRHLSYLHRFTSSNEMVRLWLKMGLYLNQEHLIYPRLKHLGAEAYQSKKVRELLGLLYYRLGEKEEALRFIDDLSTANSENIQGNLKLEKNQYELAFGHFQLALKKKQNSVNAIERSLTLSWLLGKFSEGLEIVRRVRAHQGSVSKKHALVAAFLTRNGEHQKALEELYPVVQAYQGRQPQPASELLSYNSLLAEKNDDAKKYSDLLCREKQGFYCWLLFHLNLWDDLGKTIKRDEPIFQDNELSVEELKKKAQISPLAEEKFVDQRDIEELDEVDVQNKMREL